MRIGLFLMGEKGFTALQTLLANNIKEVEIVFVVSEKDKSIEKDYYEEIQTLSTNAQIAFFNRKNTLDYNLQVDLLFAISWRWLLDIKQKLIVFHDSILPKYRGFNPLVTALINGDKDIGVTALIATEGYDEGNIIGQKSIPINYPIKIQDAIILLSKLYGEILLEVLYDFKVNKVKELAQDNSKATYSLWRDEEDYLIDWFMDAREIKRFIDAVGYPYKGSYCFLGLNKIRILHAEIIEDKVISNRTPGKLFVLENNHPVVVCGKGLLKLIDVRKDGSTTKVYFNKLRTRLK